MDDVVDVADPEQVARRRLGQAGHRPAEHLAHLLLVLAERAADGDPIDAAGSDERRGLRAQLAVHPALDDPVQQLVGPAVLALPGDAAVKPPMRALHRSQRVVAVNVERRALVERQRDVRAKRRLHLHRRLGTHEPLGAVGVGVEGHALLLDRQDAAVRRAAAALDLVGHGAVAHAENLKAARVGDDRPVPAHEPVQAAECCDLLVAGRDEQVERVAQHHLVAEAGNLGRVQAANGGVGGQRHERGRLDLAVRQAQDARAGLPRAGDDVEQGHPALILPTSPWRCPPRRAARRRRLRSGAASPARAWGSGRSARPGRTRP